MNKAPHKLSENHTVVIVCKHVDKIWKKKGDYETHNQNSQQIRDHCHCKS